MLKELRVFAPVCIQVVGHREINYHMGETLYWLKTLEGNFIAKSYLVNVLQDFWLRAEAPQRSEFLIYI